MQETPAERVRVPAPRCPYCHDEIERGVEPVSCPECHAAHHEACLIEGGGACSACGATHSRVLQQTPSLRVAEKLKTLREQRDAMILRGAGLPTSHREAATRVVVGLIALTVAFSGMAVVSKLVRGDSPLQSFHAYLPCLIAISALLSLVASKAVRKLRAAPFALAGVLTTLIGLGHHLGPIVGVESIDPMRADHGSVLIVLGLLGIGVDTLAARLWPLPTPPSDEPAPTKGT